MLPEYLIDWLSLYLLCMNIIEIAPLSLCSFALQVTKKVKEMKTSLNVTGTVIGSGMYHNIALKGTILLIILQGPCDPKCLCNLSPVTENDLSSCSGQKKPADGQKCFPIPGSKPFNLKF